MGSDSGERVDKCTNATVSESVSSDYSYHPEWKLSEIRGVCVSGVSLDYLAYKVVLSLDLASNRVISAV